MHEKTSDLLSDTRAAVQSSMANRASAAATRRATRAAVAASRANRERSAAKRARLAAGRITCWFKVHRPFRMGGSGAVCFCPVTQGMVPRC